jgi:hypothetical protein
MAQVARIPMPEYHGLQVRDDIGFWNTTPIVHNDDPKDVFISIINCDALSQFISDADYEGLLELV